MLLRYVSALALVALLLPACSSSSSSSTSTSTSTAQSASDDSSAAPSPADSSDPLAQYVPAFQKMESGIDNNFADVLTASTKSGQETPTSVGFYKQYPCTVGTNDDKVYWGYCILGVTSSKDSADADYDAAKQIVAKGDSTLTEGTPPAATGKTIAQALYQNDTHGIYIFESQQDNGKYLVKMTFAKPSALK